MDASAPPIRLFKYFPTKRLHVLTDNRIRFTPPAELNDPFEMVPHIPLTDADYEEMADEFLTKEFALQPITNPTEQSISFSEWSKHARRRRPKIIADLREYFEEFLDVFPRQMQVHLSEKCGILCLSENHESLLMWAHYTDGHNGFALEFDPGCELFNRKRVPVLYNAKRPVWQKDHQDKLSILCTKSPEWSYEREHRVIRAFGELEEGLLDTGKPGYFAPLPENFIKAVYVGCRMQHKNIKVLMETLRRPSYQHVEVYLGLPSHDCFKIDFFTLDQIKTVSPNVRETLAKVFGKDYSGIREK